jgi:hypothetical protein
LIEHGAALEAHYRFIKWLSPTVATRKPGDRKAWHLARAMMQKEIARSVMAGLIPAIHVVAL